MTDSRKIITDTLVNIRDLGGLATADSNISNFGVCVRSEALVNISQNDRQAISDYGIKTVIDLRSPAEVDRLNSSYADDCEIKYFNIPLFDAFINGLNMHLQGKNISVSELYIKVVDTNKSQISQIMGQISQSDGAVCFHCTAGRDRTGIISALLLKLIGVSNDDISADYQLSNTCLDSKYNAQSLKAKYKDVPSKLLNCDAENILDMLAYIDENFGSVENYLLSAGVTKSDIDNIKSKFLDK